MEVRQAGQILLFVISCACVWYGFFVLYKEYTVDIFRQKMFDLRDDLFDSVGGGLIDFNHPAYTILRKTMNGFLRFGHRITVLELLIQALVFWKDQEFEQSCFSFGNQWQTAIKDLDSESISKLTAYRERMNELILMQVIFSSPFFIVFFVLGLILMKLPGSFYEYCRKKTFENINLVMRYPLNNIESTAMAYGRTHISSFSQHSMD